MIIEGAVSIIVALAAGFLLPNWAHNTPWLTPEETEMAQYRLVLSAGGEDDSKKDMGMWAGAKLGAKDPVSLVVVRVRPKLTPRSHGCLWLSTSGCSALSHSRTSCLPS